MEHRECSDERGGDRIRWDVPAPALAAVPLGEGDLPNGNVDGARADPGWTDIHPVDVRTVVTAHENEPAVHSSHTYAGTPRRSMGDVSRPDVLAEIESAREALEDARLLMEAGGSHSGIIDRLYYAAQAVLFARGVNPSSHGEVRRESGQHVVLEGDASRERGRLLGVLYDYRQEADYRKTRPEVDVADLVAEVAAFIDRMWSLVQDRDAAG